MELHSILVTSILRTPILVTSILVTPLPVAPRFPSNLDHKLLSNLRMMRVCLDLWNLSIFKRPTRHTRQTRHLCHARLLRHVRSARPPYSILNRTIHDHVVHPRLTQAPTHTRATLFLPRETLVTVPPIRDLTRSRPSSIHRLFTMEESIRIASPV